jgi:ADP-ribose/FAD diphosphatase
MQIVSQLRLLGPSRSLIFTRLNRSINFNKNASPSAHRFPRLVTRAFASDVSNFCRKCGSAMELIVPEGDSKVRSVCTAPACRYHDYVNPKMVVGAIIEHEGKILLCRRGIMPQKNFWTVPAGFLEVGESTAAGAARETLEEAGAKIEILAPYVHYDIVGIGQAYLLFRAKLAPPPYTFAAIPPETLEVQLFSPAEIPFDELAFSSVSIALKSYLEDREKGEFKFRHGAIIKEPGSGPNDPGTFKLTELYTV